MLGTSLGSIVGLELGTNECVELVLWDRKVIGATLGALDELFLVTSDGTELVSPA